MACVVPLPAQPTRQAELSDVNDDHDPQALRRRASGRGWLARVCGLFVRADSARIREVKPVMPISRRPTGICRRCEIALGTDADRVTRRRLLA